MKGGIEDGERVEGVLARRRQWFYHGPDGIQLCCSPGVFLLDEWRLGLLDPAASTVCPRRCRKGRGLGSFDKRVWGVALWVI